MFFVAFGVKRVHGMMKKEKSIYIAHNADFAGGVCWLVPSGQREERAREGRLRVKVDAETK